MIYIKGTNYRFDVFYNEIIYRIMKHIMPKVTRSFKAMTNIAII